MHERDEDNMIQHGKDAEPATTNELAGFSPANDTLPHCASCAIWQLYCLCFEGLGAVCRYSFEAAFNRPRDEEFSSLRGGHSRTRKTGENSHLSPSSWSQGGKARPRSLIIFPFKLYHAKSMQSHLLCMQNLLMSAS